MPAVDTLLLLFCDRASGGIVKDGRVEADRQIDRIASRGTRMPISREPLSIVQVHGFGRKSNSPQSYLAAEVRLAELAIKNWAGFQEHSDGRRKFTGRTSRHEFAG